ncbi:MAG: di-trans,poly-cis-decaprenylcistransferase [Chlamydiae bacterium]|nr:di-trans,poly-cis-decaprenylcistransferase [Chlamydiota bacterium]
MTFDNIPHHIALIMDGNRRWANRERQPLEVGYIKGAEAMLKIVRKAATMGVKVVTAYAFSTENWNRPREEIGSVIKVFELYLRKMGRMMVKEGVRLETIGDLTAFPESIQKSIQNAKEKTKDGTKVDLILALNYGGRDDLRRAALKIASDLECGKITREGFTENLFSKYLDTARWPDPDLLIRTSGEFRVSNFLLWQISYSEVYITDVLWPDFTEDDLALAIGEFQKRVRRRGG